MSTNITFASPSMRWKRLLLVCSSVLIIIGILIVTTVEQLLPLIASLRATPVEKDWTIKLYLIGGEFLAYGVGMALVGLFIWPQWVSLVSFARRNTTAILKATIAAMLLLWLPVIIIGRSISIDGERYWWLLDDAMISMRYARNAANGLGLVWNPSERVEGYTNFLWTVYMALVHLLPLPPSKTSLVILLTNLILAIATVITITRLIHYFDGGWFVTTATIMTYTINRNVMVWAMAGLETTLLTFLFLLAVYRIICDAKNNQPRLSTFFLISLLSLVRTDAIVFSALLYLMSILVFTNKTRVLSYSGFSLILPIIHVFFRWFYYHDLIPNTAYLKVFNWEQRFIAGAFYVISFLIQYGIIIGFALFSVLRSKQRLQLYLFGIFVLKTLYIGYVGGDAFYNFRFFVPIIPILLMLAFLGVKSFILLLNEVDWPKAWLRKMRIWFVGVTCGAIGAMLSSSGWLSLGLLFFAITFVAIVSWWIGSVAASRWQREALSTPDIRPQQTILVGALSVALCIGTTPLIIPGYTTFLFPEKSAEFVFVGLFLKQHTPEDSKVAATAAGSIFYFSERYGIDLLGKVDRYIARLPVVSDGIVPGHNKFDFNYSLGILKPDFVVADFAIPVTEEQMREEAKGNTAFIGQLYFHSIFREHCLPYPIYVGSETTIVQCDWSPYFKMK